MDAETWATVRALLARGWVLAVADPQEGTTARIEAPVTVQLVGVPMAVFYTSRDAHWSKGETVEDAVRRAAAEVPAP